MTRKVNPIVIAGAALALAGIATLAVIAGSGGSNGPASRKVAALVAGVAVAPGAPAATAGLVVKRLPANAVPVGALADPAAVAGQVALRSVAAGEVVTPGTFGQQGVAAVGGVVLPPGKEGLGIELGFAPGALRFVVPGNKITVWATAKGQSTHVLLQNTQVIATTPGTGTGAASAIAAGPGNLDFLLAVTRAEAAQLIAAQVSGANLYFTLAGTGQKG